MKRLFVNPNIAEFCIDDPTFVTMIVESKPFYRKLCSYLLNGFPERDCIFSLEIGEKSKDIEDLSLYIPNPCDLDLNSKANINALYKILKKQYFNELNEAVTEIQKRLDNVCREIKLDFDAELVMESAIRVEDVFKLGGLQFSESEGSFLEKLVRFIVIARELRGIQIVFINHLHDYLEVNEIEEFTKELFYRGITLINLETNDAIDVLESEKKVIIDSDFCFIS